MKLLIAICLLSFNVSVKAYTVKPFSLESYKSSAFITLEQLNKKKVLINFWASWCTSCIEEIPLLHNLKKSKKAKEYNFIAISAGDTKKKIKKFVKRYKYNYNILMDKDSSLSKSWGIGALPVTIILDTNGKIIYEGIRPPTVLP